MVFNKFVYAYHSSKIVFIYFNNVIIPSLNVLKPFEGELYYVYSDLFMLI